MNFETAEGRALGMFNVAERLKSLAEKGAPSPFLAASIVLSAMTIEAYTNALIWLRIIEKNDQQLLEKYTCVKKGKRELKWEFIRTKVKEWTKCLTGRSFGNSDLIKKFEDLITLRNEIVHYQIELDDKQLAEFRKNIPARLVKKGKEVNNQKKKERSIDELYFRELFFCDSLTDEITLKKAQQKSIETTREVIAELNKCYYGFVPYGLR